MVIPFLVYDCNRAVNLIGVEQLSAHEPVVSRGNNCKLCF